MKKIRILTIIAALVLAATVASVGAFLTAQASKVNTFTFGEVDIDLEEPHWNVNNALNIEQGKTIAKDPVVTNTGINDAYVFMKVVIPKADIYTYNPTTKARIAKAVTPLFQINRGTRAYDGTNTVNNGWTLISSNTEGTDANEYIYAYGTASKLTKLAAEDSAPALFDSVSYCYAVEGQGLDDGFRYIDVDAYAIQTDDITASDKSDPAGVWSILTAQSGS